MLRSLQEHSILHLLCPLGTFQARAAPQTDFPSNCPLDQFTMAPEGSFISSPPGLFHFRRPILQAAWAFQHMSFLSHRVPFVQTLSWGLIFYTEHFKGFSLIPAGTIILHSRTMVFSSFSLNPLSSNRNLIEGSKISNRKARAALP